RAPDPPVRVSPTASPAASNATPAAVALVSAAASFVVVHAGMPPGLYVASVMLADLTATASAIRSAQAPLAQKPVSQSLGPRHPSLAAHGAQVPPQSTPVSLPFFMPSGAAHGATAHCPTSHTPVPVLHGVPSRFGRWPATPAAHASHVQSLSSS